MPAAKIALHYGKSKDPVLWVVPDDRYPKMYRIQWPDGSLSDMMNLTRATDTAVTSTFARRLSHERRMFRWKGRPDARGGLSHALKQAAWYLTASGDEKPKMRLPPPSWRQVAGPPLDAKAMHLATVGGGWAIKENTEANRRYQPK